MIEQAEIEQAPVHRATKKSGKHPGRQELPANLPRIERILHCTPDQRLCKRCGKGRLLERWDEARYLQIDSEDDVENCSVTGYRYDPVASKLVLDTYNEKRHLQECAAAE